MVVPTENNQGNTEEESYMEEYVVLKLPQTALSLTSGGTQFKLIGLEQGKPFLQIGNEVFQGTFKKPLGTVLLFGYQDESSSQEAQDIKPSSWGLVGHTEETIQFQKVQLRKREDEANANEAHQTYRGKEEKE